MPLTLHKRSTSFAAVTLLVACLSACASSTKAAHGTAAANSPQAAAALGSAHPASGAPVVLGMINQEGSGQGSFPELRTAAQAAVRYVNQYRGGIHGHPLKLVTCVTDGTPTGSATCANRLIADKPVAIAGGADQATTGSLPIFQQANLAYLGGTPFQAPEMTSPNSVQFYGFAVGVYPGMAAFTADYLKAKKASVIVANNPVAVSATQHFLVPVLKAKGTASVTTVPAPVDSPDFTTYYTQAASTQPDAVLAPLNGNACVGIMQAHQNLGSTTKLVVAGTCIAKQIISAAGAAADDVYANDDFDPPGSPNKDVQIFQAALAKYAPSDISVDEFAQAGFSTIMNIWQTLNNVPSTTPTTATILKSFRTGSDHPNFMAHPYTCDGKQVPGASAVCNAAQRFVQIRNGRAVQVGTAWYDGTKYIKN